MKIAINTLSIIPGKVGGAETFLVNLIKNLVKIDQKNNFFIIVSQNNKKIFDLDSKNTEYLEFNFNNNSRAKRVFFEQLILPKKLKKKKIDLFIAPGNTGLIYCPCKMILIIQSLHYFIFPDLFPIIRRKYLQSLAKYSCRKAKRVVTVSTHTKKDINGYTNTNLDKIDVIYEGVDFSFFDRRRDGDFNQKILNQHNVGGKYIFSPTSLHGFKNNNSLIKVFALAKKRKKIPHKLVIAGVDPYNKINKLRRLAQALGVEKEFIYLGSVSHAHIPTLYQRADLTIFLSLYETFGLPVLEAMAAGCPVLSSNRSSLPEVVGDAGILVDPFNIEEVANKMYELLTNKNLREECIEKGLIRAKEFSWENVARRLIKIYSNLSLTSK